MFEQIIFIGSLAGVVSTIAWILARFLFRDDDAKMRDRLKVRQTGTDARPEKTSLGEFVQHIGAAAASPFMPKTREKQSAIRRQLALAGIYDPAAIRAVMGFKFILLLGGLAGGYVLGAFLGNMLLGFSVGALIGYMVPSFWIRSRIKSHRRALQLGLPDALDLLVVCVEAGLTVDAAMQRVGHEIAIGHPSLSRELDITHMETRVGVPRADAMRNMGIRTGMPHLQTLATMVIQAERFGTSIAAALRVHADTLRFERQSRAEETAAKASVKLSFPVVLFIFPAVLIVLAGPALIGLLNSALFAD
ncbi:MAG: type II secretion system F family protein [Tepidisphaerales bacterium]